MVASNLRQRVYIYTQHFMMEATGPCILVFRKLPTLDEIVRELSRKTGAVEFRVKFVLEQEGLHQVLDTAQEELQAQFDVCGSSLLGKLSDGGDMYFSLQMVEVL